MSDSIAAAATKIFYQGFRKDFTDEVWGKLMAGTYNGPTQWMLSRTITQVRDQIDRSIDDGDIVEPLRVQ